MKKISIQITAKSCSTTCRATSNSSPVRPSRPAKRSTHEGKEYPLIKIEVSAESHPFYTGKHKIVDTAGRVEKFRQKFGAVGSKTASPTANRRPAGASKKAAHGCFFFAAILRDIQLPFFCTTCNTYR
jgi:ribosomal protein L31